MNEQASQREHREHGLKRSLVSLLTAPAVEALTRRLLDGRLTVFMLHRFTMSDAGVTGHDPDEIRGVIGFLRERGYRFVSLLDALEQLASGQPVPDRAVAFTIDDGYADQALVAAPLFADLECPVTTFVCTGFLDRELWMWWDKIEFALDRTSRSEIELSHDGRVSRLALSTPEARAASKLSFTEHCKTLPDAEKHAAIDALAGHCGVELPKQAPDRYAPMTWDQLREAEALGMRFAPHTRTHPILSRTPDDQARHEIASSRERLAAEARHPQNVFCYPNGQRGDFGRRELDVLAGLGFVGSVVGYPGYVGPSDFADDPSRRFELRRFALPTDRLDALQYVSGIEWLKRLARRED